MKYNLKNNGSRDSWDLLVDIKSEHLKSLPFIRIRARAPTATILSYLGFRHQVIPILQTLSHKVRAYIFNANGLQGFLINLDISWIIKDASIKQRLHLITRWQHVDTAELYDSLDRLDSHEEKLEHLRLNYPCLYIYALNRIERRH